MVTAARTPCPGLIPVAAYLDELAARQVPVLDLDRRRRGQAGGEQAALEGEGGGPLPVVPAGVVDEDRRAGGELHADLGVIVVELPEPEPARADEEAEHAVLRGQRQQEHGRADEQLRDRPAQP
jgi:hypothetical protein